MAGEIHNLYLPLNDAVEIRALSLALGYYIAGGPKKFGVHNVEGARALAERLKAIAGPNP